MRKLILIICLSVFATSAVSFGRSGGGEGGSSGDVNNGWGAGDDDGGGGFGSGGGDGCGGCDSTLEFWSSVSSFLAEEEKSDATELLAELTKKTLSELRIERAMGRLCVTNNCRGLKPSIVDSIVGVAIDESLRISAENQRLRDLYIQIANLILFFATAYIAWLAYKHSRSADKRSIRNEVTLEAMQDGNR